MDLKKLKYWETTVLLIWSKTIGTQAHTHTHTYTHRSTDFTGKMTKITSFWTFRTFLLYILVFYKLKQQAKSPKTHLLRGQAPPKWQVLVEAPGVHHKRRPLDLTKMIQNRQYKYQRIECYNRNSQKMQGKTKSGHITCEKLGFFTRNHCSCVTLAPKYHYLLQKSWI